MTDEPRPDDSTPSETPPETAAIATAEQPAEADGQEAKPAKLSQEVEFKDIGPCKKHIKVVIARDAIDAKMQEQFKKLVTDHGMSVPGFRPGVRSTA